MIRLNDEFIPPPDEPAEEVAWDIHDLVWQLKEGRPSEKKRALIQLVAAGAEEELTRCLTAKDPFTAQLATAGLWECWLNEEGPEARFQIEHGIGLMKAGDLIAAERFFFALSKQYPGWAEPINKQATVLFQQGHPTDSFDLCELVTEMKPNHFGAWHGLALSALQLGDWETAFGAAREALRLQPRSTANRELVRVAEERLRFA